MHGLNAVLVFFPFLRNERRFLISECCLRVLNRFTDSNEMWYEQYTIGGNLKLTPFNFIQFSIADTQTSEVGAILAPQNMEF
jgi:hypothetical protein